MWVRNGRQVRRFLPALLALAVAATSSPAWALTPAPGEGQFQAGTFRNAVERNAYIDGYNRQLLGGQARQEEATRKVFVHRQWQNRQGSGRSDCGPEPPRP